VTPYQTSEALHPSNIDTPGMQENPHTEIFPKLLVVWAQTVIPEKRTGQNQTFYHEYA